ncbi:MAG: haloacid dehalogenase-like hydrolase, partial [Schwartzia sp.]|nr:haloacid dehalogenase-like hydrolase [Schwartzia sp. (in: firmicutes)]
MKHNKLCAALTAAMIGAGCWLGAPSSEAMPRTEIAAMKAPKSGNLRYWTKNSVAKEKLVSYVKDVTDKESKNFIPVADRVAVFDM